MSPGGQVVAGRISPDLSLVWRNGDWELARADGSLSATLPLPLLKLIQRGWGERPSPSPHSPILTLVRPLRSSGKVHSKVYWSEGWLTDWWRSPLYPLRPCIAEPSSIDTPFPLSRFLSSLPLLTTQTLHPPPSRPSSTVGSQIRAVGVISRHHFIPLPWDAFCTKTFTNIKPGRSQRKKKKVKKPWNPTKSLTTKLSCEGLHLSGHRLMTATGQPRASRGILGTATPSRRRPGALRSGPAVPGSVAPRAGWGGFSSASAAVGGTNGPAPRLTAPRRCSADVPLPPRRGKGEVVWRRNRPPPQRRFPLPPFPSAAAASRRGAGARCVTCRLGGSLTCARLFQWQRTCRAAPPNQRAARPSAPLL